MTDDLIRWLAAVQVMVLLSCGFTFHRNYRPAVPITLWRLGWAYGYVIGLLAVAILVNIVFQQPVTIGLQLVTLLLAPATGYVGWEAIRIARLSPARLTYQQKVIAHAPEIAEWMLHMSHAEPCATRDCRKYRHQGRRFLGL